MRVWRWQEIFLRSKLNKEAIKRQEMGNKVAKEVSALQFEKVWAGPHSNEAAYARHARHTISGVELPLPPSGTQRAVRVTRLGHTVT